VRLDHHVALVTGGGSGIGFALARDLLARGNIVIAAGRSARRLAQAREAAPGLHVIECDVTDDAQLHAMLERIDTDFGRLSLLVNNAGVMSHLDLLAGAATDVIEREVATDFVAPVKLTLLALPRLLREPVAAVVNVTAGVALAPIAAMPLYCASKAALHSFSMSLRHQLAHTNVRVFDVMPPATETELSRNIKTKREPVDSVATQALRGIERDRFEIVIGQWKLVRLTQRIARGYIDHKILGFDD